MWKPIVASLLFILFLAIWILGGGWALSFFGAENYLLKVLLVGTAGVIGSFVTSIIAKVVGII